MALAVAAAGSVTPAVVDAASTTSISATPSTSVAGQSVTFTASFSSVCAGALSPHYFTIDGTGINGTLAQSGQAGTETLTTSALAVGSHTVTYYWKNGSFCQGKAEMSYTVSARPSPSPSPLPSPSPTPIQRATPSPSAVALVASKQSDSPLAGYLGVGLIVVVLVAGAALAVLSRR